MTEDLACPRCDGKSEFFKISVYRGEIYECKTCLIPHPTTEEKIPLLWFWDSNRLWQADDEPESLEKPKLVKVIIAIDPEKII